MRHLGIVSKISLNLLHPKSELNFNHFCSLLLSCGSHTKLKQLQSHSVLNALYILFLLSEFH